MAAEREDRLWHRGLKNDRVEAYIALDENFVHVIGTPSVVQSIVTLMEEKTGHDRPVGELRGPRRKSRGPQPMNGQLVLDA